MKQLLLRNPPKAIQNVQILLSIGYYLLRTLNSFAEPLLKVVQVIKWRN